MIPFYKAQRHTEAKHKNIPLEYIHMYDTRLIGGITLEVT